MPLVFVVVVYQTKCFPKCLRLHFCCGVRLLRQHRVEVTRLRHFHYYLRLLRLRFCCGVRYLESLEIDEQIDLSVEFVFVDAFVAVLVKTRVHFHGVSVSMVVCMVRVVMKMVRIHFMFA